MTVADEIAKLDALRKSGALTEEEFEQQKKVFLGATSVSSAPIPEPTAVLWKDIPIWEKYWAQAIVLLLIPPVGILVMLALPAYRRRATEAYRVSKLFKGVLICLASVTWIAFLARQDDPSTNGRTPQVSDTVATSAANQGADAATSNGHSEKSAVPAAPDGSSNVADSTRGNATVRQLPSCDSTDVYQAAKSAVADSEIGANGVTLENWANVSESEAAETRYKSIEDELADTRLCTADFKLSDGAPPKNLMYRVSRDADGSVAVDIIPNALAQVLLDQ